MAEDEHASHQLQPLQPQQQRQQQQQPQLPQLQLHLYSGTGAYLEPVAAQAPTTDVGTRPGSFTLSGCYGGSLTASASDPACSPSVEAFETDAAAAAAAAATALASATTLRGSPAGSSSGLIAAPRPPDGVPLYPFTSPTGSSSSRCNGAPVATVAHQDAEEQQTEMARASRSSDMGSSCKSNAEHASAQFTSSVHLMGNHGIHGHNSSQADLAPSTVASAGRADQSSTYPSAEVMRVEAATSIMSAPSQAPDGTLGTVLQDSADMDPFTGNDVELLCGKAHNLVLEMSEAAVPAWRAAARAVPNTSGLLGCGGINVEQDLAELRSRICHLELKLEQRDGASLAEAHAQAAALKKEFGQLETNLAEALWELRETKDQVRVLQRQIGAGTTSRLLHATEPVASGLDVNASSTQVLTPTFPRPPTPAIVPPQGVASTRSFPASPEQPAHLVPRSAPSSHSSESCVGTAACTGSLSGGGASTSGGFLEWQQQQQQQQSASAEVAANASARCIPISKLLRSSLLLGSGESVASTKNSIQEDCTEERPPCQQYPLFSHQSSVFLCIWFLEVE
mmetsp:Transcript_91563/g.181983  ORF Transcript_91563/g.181983 Transcript_91563/m.181983 type:complete len:567 (+) Transcript_91563:62-1762(+)